MEVFGAPLQVELINGSSGLQLRDFLAPTGTLLGAVAGVWIGAGTSRKRERQQAELLHGWELDGEFRRLRAAMRVTGEECERASMLLTTHRDLARPWSHEHSPVLRVSPDQQEVLASWLDDDLWERFQIAEQQMRLVSGLVESPKRWWQRGEERLGADAVEFLDRSSTMIDELRFEMLLALDRVRASTETAFLSDEEVPDEDEV